jgi:hypothetical protein
LCGQRLERGDALAQRLPLGVVDPTPAGARVDDERRLPVVVDLVDLDGHRAVVVGQVLDARAASRRESEVSFGQQQERDPRLCAQARQRSAVAPQVDEDAPVAGADRRRDRDRERAAVHRGEHGDDPAGPFGKRVKRRMPAHRNHRERNGITTLTINATSVPLITRARSAGDIALSWSPKRLRSAFTIANATSQAASVVASRAVRGWEASMERKVREVLP